MKLENKNIIIVSNEIWGKTWYSKHNYAWELSKKNRVIFINPPQKFRFLNTFIKNIENMNVSENLSVITYKNILPVRFELLRYINERIIFKKIRKYLLKKNYNECIFWTFDPIRLSQTEIIKPNKVILHIVDDYMFTYPSEKILTKKADIVLVVSEEIAVKYKKYNSNIHIIYHAIPNDEFITSEKKINKRKKAIYVGNIDKRLDYIYLEYIISNLPGVDFYFVGNVNNEIKNIQKSFLEKYNNVFFKGEKPYNELKYYISESDLCFVFKDIKHPGNNISSHKMLQYFAQGKPIFSTLLSRYSDIEHLIYMENDKKNMLNKILYFLNNGEADHLLNDRIDYAKKHTFKNTIDKIEKIL